MPLSTELSQNLQLLEKLDVNKFAISFKNRHLDKVFKRTDFCNFLSYFIYIITFTLVARNPKLDRAAKYVFNAVKAELSGAFAEDEKTLLSKALNNLRVVIKKNGGCDGKMARRILEAVKKIKVFSEKNESLGYSPLRPAPSPLADIFIAKMEANPPSTPDTFFENLVMELLEGTSFEGLNRYAIGNFFSKNLALKKALPKIAEHVFQRGSPERMEILVQKLHPHLISFIIELIPVEVFSNVEPKKLLDIAEEVVNDHVKVPNEMALRVAARMLTKFPEEEKEESFNERAVWYFLLPYFTSEFQKELLSHFLNLYICPTDLDLESLCFAPIKAWEAAAGEIKDIPWKEEYTKFPIDIIYALAVKQVENPNFITSFFEVYFKEAEDKCALIVQMTPEFIDAAFVTFKIDQFSNLKVFLEVLKAHPNQKHAQIIFERVSIAIFDLLSEIPAENGLELFKAFSEGTTETQRELLKMGNFKKPEARLLLACITDHLGAIEFTENVHLLDREDSKNLVIQLNFLDCDKRDAILRQLLSMTKEEIPVPVAFVLGWYQAKALPTPIFYELHKWMQTIDPQPKEFEKCLKNIPKRHQKKL